MATVSIATLSDLSAPDFNDRMEDTDTNSAFVPLRGNLDLDNLDVGTTTSDDGIAYTKLRNGQLTKVWTAAGTANLDYRLYWYEGQDATDWATSAAVDPEDRALDIPGGGVSIYVPETGYVMFDWQVMWGNDAFGNEGGSWLFLRVDGSTVAHQRRPVSTSVASTTIGGVAVDFLGYGQHMGYAKNRLWSGHHFVSLSAGWHNVSLCVGSGKGALNTRVWARSMRAVWMGPA